jgi:hypothetical protein
MAIEKRHSVHQRGISTQASSELVSINTDGEINKFSGDGVGSGCASKQEADQAWLLSACTIDPSREGGKHICFRIGERLDTE